MSGWSGSGGWEKLVAGLIEACRDRRGLLVYALGTAPYLPEEIRVANASLERLGVGCQIIEFDVAELVAEGWSVVDLGAFPGLPKPVALHRDEPLGIESA